MRDLLYRDDDVRVAATQWNSAIQGDAAIHQVSGNGTNSIAKLTDATDDQELRFAQVFGLIDEAIARKAFPGAALAVTHGGELVALRGFGRFTYDAGAPTVKPDTVWDLASLTKAVATTPMAMILFDRKSLSLDMPVVEVLPEFGAAGLGQTDWRRAVTVRMLLAHSSGLPAHRKLYLEATGCATMLAAALRVGLETAPGTHAEYSDMGFILLGELLRRIANDPLDLFCRREIFSPLTIGLTFSPYITGYTDVPPTINDNEYRQRVVQGEVNDENASAMGGVAGHAGLFGDALSVARFAECMLRGGEGIFRPETVRLFTTRQEKPQGTSRALGWDTPSQPSQSGTRFSARSFGHLGYTGTSLWCDPERGLSVILLTNRTWPDARNQSIKEVRPLVHDAIVSAVENG